MDLVTLVTLRNLPSSQRLHLSTQLVREQPLRYLINFFLSNSVKTIPLTQ